MRAEQRNVDRIPCGMVLGGVGGGGPHGELRGQRLPYHAYLGDDRVCTGGHTEE